MKKKTKRTHHAPYSTQKNKNDRMHNFSQNVKQGSKDISNMTSRDTLSHKQKKLKSLPTLKKPFNLHFKLQKPKTIRSSRRTIRSIHIRIPHSKKRNKEMKELSSGQAKKMQKQGVSAIQQALKDILVVGNKKEKKQKSNTIRKHKKAQRKMKMHKNHKKR